MPGFAPFGLVTKRARVPLTDTWFDSRFLLCQAAIAAAAFTVSLSGSSPAGTCSTTWLPGRPRTWNHQSFALAILIDRRSLSRSVRPARTTQPPGSS